MNVRDVLKELLEAGHKLRNNYGKRFLWKCTMFLSKSSALKLNCGRGFCCWPSILLLLFVFIQTGGSLFAEISNQKERVAWGGVSFRGLYQNRTLQFPYCAKEKILAEFQEKLTYFLKNAQNSDCDLLIGQQFDFTAGDRLVASCVLESEDATIVEHDGVQFGQITISASLIVFDFQAAIVVSSLPIGAIYVIEPEKAKGKFQNDTGIESFVKAALIGAPGVETCLSDQVAKRFYSMPIHLKGNFRNLQVAPVQLDEKTEKALNISDQLSREKWKNYFANRIADSLSSKFGINIVPCSDGDGSLSTMTISFADKSRLPADASLDQALSVKPPSVVAKADFSNAGDYVIKKASTLSQVAKTYGCVAALTFIEQDREICQYNWSYGINRVFAPEHADDQSAAQKSLYHRAAIENGCNKKFIMQAEKDSKWLKFAETLRK